MWFFFKSRKFKAILSITVVLCILLVSSLIFPEFRAWQSDAAAAVITPIQKFCSNISGGISDFFDNMQENEKLKKEIAQIKKSEDFASLVRTYSDAPGAEQGGNVGDVDEDKLRPEFSAVLQKAAIGDMPGPVETPEGYYFIRVENITAEKKIPYENVAEKIRQHLENAERIKIRRSYGERLKAGAVIKYYF